MNDNKRTISPRQIYEEVDKVVVGQHKAKKTMATSFFLQLIKLISPGTNTDTGINPNVLLMGPTGCGKTYLVRETIKAIRKLTGYVKMFPILEIDCTQLSARGWQGNDMTDLVIKHHTLCVDKEEVFRSSVIFLDEIDKLCKSAVGAGGTDHNRNTQYGLLKLIEGMCVQIERKNFITGKIMPTIDTTGLLFVLAGNFSEVRALRDKRKKRLGFTSAERPSISHIDYHRELDKAGMATQLVGRIPIVSELYPLTEEHLLTILNNADYFKALDSIKVTKKSRLEIVRDCIKKGTGARGLYVGAAKYVEDNIFDMKFDIY